MFDGFFAEDSTVFGVVIVKNGSSVPADADSLPAFRVYSGSEVIPVTGTCQPHDIGVITDASNNNPIVITSANHGRVDGDRVSVSGVTGNTAANGTWSINVLDGDTFELTNSTGSGNYVSGGTWNQTGIYSFSFVASSDNNITAGHTYTVLVTTTVGGFPFSEQHNFCVN